MGHGSSVMVGLYKWLKKENKPKVPEVSSRPEVLWRQAEAWPPGA